MKAVLRRGSETVSQESGVIKAGPVVMDIERHMVTVNGERIQMPLKEFELLELLMENVNRVLTRGQIIDRVWGSNYFGDTKTLDVHVKRIRSKIEDDPSRPRHLLTVRGLGYKFEV
jgi:two-component system response regulator RegX3